MDTFTSVRHLDSGGSATVVLVEDSAGQRFARKELQNVFRDLETAKEAAQDVAALFCVRKRTEFSTVKLVEVLQNGKRIRSLAQLTTIKRTRRASGNVTVTRRPSFDGVSVYIYMEVLQEEIIESLSRIPVDQRGEGVCGSCRSLLGGLEFIHRRNLQHRDIKPANVMVDAEGNAKLIDMGISRFCSEDDLSAQVAGTEGPERGAAARGRKDPQDTRHLRSALLCLPSHLDWTFGV
uniref:Protein kinase domain-containing protein n=1 Tax=Chromera velia CCMP2878 TaxID=1169474 RepID=A0A0G4HTE6_9ALVE|eukprot:Cvel_8474.t1-p1 / transcript=Cvel_8474.t1 / gene=Cvel_8474 / organism=Chromera_velia_CCMP2878 / gene_product=Mitogen-activated protein kinase kinase kinase 1, putative / transcript_product=Mitogen-activated protein kinase kinase kinase 1, putative / location=Cvel_scaffold468:31125-32294(-) / protein_length=235 / sequence_SO=supercontig / SO=protein_coding / is_pseudo=false